MNLSDYGMSASCGYLSSFELPDVGLPDMFAPVVDAAENLSALMTSGRVRTLLAEGSTPRRLEGRRLLLVRNLLHECASGIGGEVSARQRAGRLAEAYLRLNDEGRATFLRIVATEFGPDPQQVAKAHADYQAAIGSDAQWAAESALRNAMRSSRLRILTQGVDDNTLEQIAIDSKCDLFREIYGYEVVLAKS